MFVNPVLISASSVCLAVLVFLAVFVLTAASAVALAVFVANDVFLAVFVANDVLFVNPVLLLVFVD